jgi:hypothetical protein
MQEADRPTMLDEFPWQSWPRVIFGAPSDGLLYRYNWRGLRDMSGTVAVDVYSDRLTILGQITDDYPLQQPYEKAVKPAWWRVPHAGDAIEVEFLPLDEYARPVTVLVSFGAEGTNPQLFVTRTQEGKAGPVLQATVVVRHTPSGYEFVARSLEMDEFGLKPFWSVGYRIKVTAHDYDTAPEDYAVLRSETLTKP